MNLAPMPRYLTKTRFKMAIECPTKLYYTGKPKIYADANQQNDFLMALAQGGFQVGELAKLMYPGGYEIESSVHEEAVRETQKLLQQDEVILFEAAIRHGGLFARVDVLRKSGDQIELIEVKAKSFDSNDPLAFRQKSGGINSGMLPYLQDVAFQRHVMSLAFPDLKIKSFLMLADKSKACTVDGLHQKFKICQDKDGRSSVRVEDGTNSSNIGEPILTCVNVDDLVDVILTKPIKSPGTTGTVAQLSQTWADHYQSDKKIIPTIGAHCAKCEFRAVPGTSELQSGMHECWRQALGWTDAQIEQGTVLDIWNFKHKQALIDSQVYRLDAVTKAHLKYAEDDEGLSPSQRQWMQVSGKWPGGKDFYLDRELMAREMATWKFPLHFIDFETARVPIPFFSGQRPYANIAFQFSHHEVQADGSVAHKSQFLSTTPGVRPNYQFVRELQKAIGNHGTVFMWSPHENTTLNAILEELEDDPSPPQDADQIRATVLELTILNKGKLILHKGKRAMVDLCNLAESAFFHPSTKGSSSIKKVLPAVLQSSTYLRDRYSQPIYGNLAGIPSLNFTDQVWWKQSGNCAENPYKLLPSVFSDIPQEIVENMESESYFAIAEGGAATTAFARLQFDTISIEDRMSTEAALLRYCELDTLAMVMIYEAWREFVGPTNA
ncbi:MAG: DUF2779 domain-containing protein [Polaromonas sp.]|nr:DUF2779 domain-containing protein [Polaromonas sp.]